MPWSVGDVDKHKKGLSDKQKKQWCRIANSVLARCIAKGGSESECAGSAIRQASGVVGNSISQYSVCRNKQDADYEIELKVHQEKAHLVAPVVMMVEGVLNGSHGPLLHLAEDFGKFPESWNGIPVVIDHPEEDGKNISANSPEIIDSRTVGRVYNTNVDGKSLKAKVWLDEEKLNEISPEVLSDINNNKLIEVSVGVFTEEEETEGEYKGTKYSAIARNHRPDHLAILTEALGACSIDDGCGLGANAQVSAMEAKRKELGMSVSEFYAVPRDPPSDSKLPIFDEAHVKNAMARFNQTQGLSSAEKATARRKILAKAKKYKIDTSGFEKIEKNAEEKELTDSMNLVNLSGYSLSLIGNNKEEGYKERLDAVYTALRQLDSSESHYLEELYDDELIFSKYTKEGTKMYKQGYKFESGKIELTGNPVEVHREVAFIVNNNVNLKKEDKKMSDNKCPKCVEKINALIANKDSGFVEADREWMDTLTEAALDKIAPKVIEKKVEVKVNELTPEQQADLAYVAKQRTDNRNSMIQEIQANTSKELWPDDAFKNMNEDFLKRVFDSVKKEKVADYSLMGGGINTNSNEIEPLAPAGVEFETVKK